MPASGKKGGGAWTCKRWRRGYFEARDAGHGPVEHYRLTRRMSGSRRRALAATWMAYARNMGRPR